FCFEDRRVGKGAGQGLGLATPAVGAPCPRRPISRVSRVGTRAFNTSKLTHVHGMRAFAHPTVSWNRSVRAFSPAERTQDVSLTNPTGAHAGGMDPGFWPNKPNGD